MKSQNDPVSHLLVGPPTPGLPEALRLLTLTLARAHLAHPPRPTSGSLRYALPTYATSAALLSADAAFLANTCLNISRAFGG